MKCFSLGNAITTVSLKTPSRSFFLYQNLSPASTG